ncbi:hypothetical protein N7462_005661 [Penicillium macrosclerotiorum]|uniref:uncharacterized protein n=1 Tax=Penicillium macrosclerotiorum TaxID=303699 RepID=UPI00254903F3|nr:uncharacterized protein N7462_005661 [Penicillium macrosclerotiorum]KAJ5682496.1 hypothetical protein N7462_005661 [Penicillium macrosclerotiorum]
MDAEYQPSDFESETTSLSSTIYKGVMENGRRYQTLREGEYWGPSDEQQFESYEAGHLACVILDSNEANPLFQSPHVLDLGTGRGSWAIDVADIFPEVWPIATVRGVDLFPPPVSWLPPNCIMEVDDVLKEWTWRQPFDLIYLRQMIGAFTIPEWEAIFKQCYDNLVPGGWIECVERDPRISCDDGSITEGNSSLFFGKTACEAAVNWGRPITLVHNLKDMMEKAGFVDIHEKVYKWPIGPWPKDPILKEAGRLHYHQWATGMEGWAMYLLTKYAVPKPWSKEEVQVLMAKVRKEIRNPRHHIYQTGKRVWGRKPTAEEVAKKNAVNASTASQGIKQETTSEVKEEIKSESENHHDLGNTIKEEA